MMGSTCAFGKTCCRSMSYSEQTVLMVEDEVLAQEQIPDLRALLAFYSISGSETFFFHFSITLPSRIKVLCIFALPQNKPVLHLSSRFRSEDSDFSVAGKPQVLLSLPTGNPVQTAVVYHSQGRDKPKQESLFYQCPSPGGLSRRWDSPLLKFMDHFRRKQKKPRNCAENTSQHMLTGIALTCSKTARDHLINGKFL